MSSNNILADKDINAPTNIEIHNKDGGKGDVKSMEYHRQILQSKLDEGQYVVFSFLFFLLAIEASVVSSANMIFVRRRGKQTYVSPSDTLMSPCTAKITALRTKQIGIK